MLHQDDMRRSLKSFSRFSQSQLLYLMCNESMWKKVQQIALPKKKKLKCLTLFCPAWQISGKLSAIHWSLRPRTPWSLGEFLLAADFPSKPDRSASRNTRTRYNAAIHFESVRRVVNRRLVKSIYISVIIAIKTKKRPLFVRLTSFRLNKNLC